MERGRKGVSLLLEIIIGLGIFAVAVLLVLGIFTTTARASIEARNDSLALHLAHQLMTEECTTAYASVTSVPTTATSITTTDNGVQSDVHFKTRVDVTEVVAGKRKDVIVTVSWQQGQASRHVALETYVVNP